MQKQIADYVEEKDEMVWDVPETNDFWLCPSQNV